MRHGRVALASAIVAGTLWSGSAWAAWPTSVVGTWNMISNQTVIKFVVSSQSGSGACQAIAGTMTDTAPAGGTSAIQGWYCPTTGRLHMLRKDTRTNDTFQAYSGNLAEVGSILRLGGVFAGYDNPTKYGEYEFYAVMQKPQ